MRTFGASSGAMLRVTMFNPALPAPYAVNAGCTIDAARDEMLTTAPPPAVSTITGTTSRVSRNGAMTLKRSACSNPSALVRSAGRGGQPPALFTRMSMRPNSSTDRGDEVLELVALEHVGRDDERPPPGRPHPLGRGLEVGLGARRAHHVGPGLGEGHRGAGTDALARAGHDGHPVGQLELVEDHGRTVGVRTPFVGRARRVARGVARVGCSGWVYRDWRGIVYPEHLPQRAWFAHYATLFDTVEINNTFYRLPAAVDRRGVGRAGARRASCTR